MQRCNELLTIIINLTSEGYNLITLHYYAYKWYITFIIIINNNYCFAYNNNNIVRRRFCLLLLWIMMVVRFCANTNHVYVINDGK